VTARLARRLLVAAVILGLWEFVRRAGLVSAVILASPSEIYLAFLSSGSEFLLAFRVTLGEIAVAIVIAWTLGLIAGLFLGTAAYAAAVIGPLLSSLFAIPLITWYPLLMIWLGIGSTSKIAYAALSGFFPIVLNTLNGVRQLDRQYVRFGRSIGCSHLAILFKIMLPLALPSVLSGLRIGTALIVIGVIVTEMLASVGGIGFWITYHRNLYDTGQVYLGILLSLICVLVVNLTLSRVERRFGAWRESEALER